MYGSNLTSLSVYLNSRSVGIASRYDLDCQGIDSWWRQDFPHLFILTLALTKPSVQWVPGHSRRKAPTPSSAEVKERVEPYLYTPFGPSWQVIG
jgi:hypothetical protein